MPALSSRDDSRKSSSWQAGAYLGITFALFSLALAIAVRRRISVMHVRNAEQRILADTRRVEVPYMWEVDISQGKGRMRTAPDEWEYWQPLSADIEDSSPTSRDSMGSLEKLPTEVSLNVQVAMLLRMPLDRRDSHASPEVAFGLARCAYMDGEG